MDKSISETIVLPPERALSNARKAGEFGHPSWIVPGRKLDPASILRGHRSLVIGLVFAVLAVGAVLVMMVPHTYRGEATIRVTPTYVASISMNSEVRFDPNVEYHDYVQQQIYEISNYATAVKALDLLGPNRDLFQLPNESARRAAERLTKEIEVQAIPNSYLVTIGFESSDPTAAAEVANAVAKAYMDRHNEQESGLNHARLQQLTDRKSHLDEQVQTLSGQLDQIARDLGTTSFDSEAGNPYDKMRTDAATALGQAKETLIKAQSHLSALETERSRPQQTQLDANEEPAAAGSDRTNGSSSDAAAELRKQREAIFLQLRGLASNHPGRKALEKEMADLEAETQRLRSNALENLIGAAETNIDEARRNERGLEAAVADLDKRAAQFASSYNQGVALLASIRRDQKEVQDLDARLNSVLTEAHTPGIVQVEAQARVPELPEKGTRRKIAMVFALLAIALGIGIPTLLDLTDSRVRTVRELEEIIGIPALGVAQLAGGGSARASRDLLRRMALAIMRERRNSGNRVFVLTSVEKGSGTTSLALALESEMIMLGANAVALEANPLSPDSRYCRPHIAGRSNPRLESNNATTAMVDQIATRQLHLNGIDHDFLSRIVKQRPHGGVEISPEMLQRLLDEQLAKRDIVLLDAPPVLASADAEMLVQLPAATVLIVKAGQDRVKRIKAAAEAIARISPPVVGAVLLQEAPSTAGLEPVAAENLETVSAERPRVAAQRVLGGGELLAAHKV
jgi:succinoglycan biosynthesis transport protein ExoP